MTGTKYNLRQSPSEDVYAVIIYWLAANIE